MKRVDLFFLTFVLMGLLVLLGCNKSSSVSPESTSKIYDVASLGADISCAKDATSTINSALSKAVSNGGVVKLPAGCYLVSDALTLPSLISTETAKYNQSVKILGDGPGATVIKVSENFNLSAKGVFVLTQDQLYTQGAQIEGLSIVFTQPDSSNIADMIHYPVAINIDGASRSKIISVDIWDAWDGISALGTYTSGTYIPDTSAWELQNVGMTAYHTGINQDGSWDTIQINNFHFQFTYHDWGKNPATVNQKAAVFFGYATGLQTGKADDIKINNSLIAGNMALVGGKGAINNGAYITIVNTSFDAGASILWQNPKQLQISNSSFYTADVNAGQIAPVLKAEMGNVFVSNSYFNSTSVLSTRPMISYAPVVGGGFSDYSLSVTGSTFVLNGANVNEASAISLALDAPDFLNAIIQGNTFLRPNALVYTNAIVDVTTAGYVNLSVIGNNFTQEAGGTGKWISIDTDGPYMIQNNIFNTGLTSSYPASPTIGTYQ